MTKILKKLLFLVLLMGSFFTPFILEAMEEKSEFTGKNGTTYVIRPMVFTETEEEKLIALEKANADDITASQKRPFFNFVREEKDLRFAGFFIRYCEESGWPLPSKSWIAVEKTTQKIVGEIFVMSPLASEISIIVHPEHQGQGIAQAMHHFIHSYNMTHRDQDETGITFKENSEEVNNLPNLTSYEAFKDSFNRILDNKSMEIKKVPFQGLFGSVHSENTASLRVSLASSQMTHVFNRFGTYESGLHVGFSLQNWCDIGVRQKLMSEDLNLDRHFYGLFLKEEKRLMMGGCYGWENNFNLTEETFLALDLALMVIEEQDGFKRINFEILKDFIPSFGETKALVEQAVSREESVKNSALEELQRRFPAPSFYSPSSDGEALYSQGQESEIKIS